MNTQDVKDRALASTWFLSYVDLLNKRFTKKKPDISQYIRSSRDVLGFYAVFWDKVVQFDKTLGLYSSNSEYSCSFYLNVRCAPSVLYRCHVFVCLTFSPYSIAFCLKDVCLCV